HRVGNRVDRNLRDRVQSQDQIGRKAAVQVGQRIVGLQAVDNISVGKRRQAIELHIAVTIRATYEIVPAAGRVDQSAGGELQRIGEVAAGIRKIFEGAGAQSRR